MKLSRKYANAMSNAFPAAVIKLQVLVTCRAIPYSAWCLLLGRPFFHMPSNIQDAFSFLVHTVLQHVISIPRILNNYSSRFLIHHLITHSRMPFILTFLSSTCPSHKPAQICSTPHLTTNRISTIQSLMFACFFLMSRREACCTFCLDPHLPA